MRYFTWLLSTKSAAPFADETFSFMFTPFHRKSLLAMHAVMSAFLTLSAEGTLSGAPGMPTTGPSGAVASASSFAVIVLRLGKRRWAEKALRTG